MRLEYFQMVDRVTALDTATGTVRVESVLPETSPIFEGHFPGYPIMPGVLMIETMAQTGGWLVMALLKFERMAFLASVKEAKMRSFLVPGQAMVVEANLVHEGSGYSIVDARILADGKRIADTTITYRVMPFPNATLRDEMLRAAQRVSIPTELLPHG